MTIKDFRKILHGVDSDVVVVFSFNVSPGDDVQNVFVPTGNVTEYNKAFDDGSVRKWLVVELVEVLPE